MVMEWKECLCGCKVASARNGASRKRMWRKPAKRIAIIFLSVQITSSKTVPEWKMSDGDEQLVCGDLGAERWMWK